MGVGNVVMAWLFRVFGLSSSTQIPGIVHKLFCARINQTLNVYLVVYDVWCHQLNSVWISYSTCLMRKVRYHLWNLACVLIHITRVLNRLWHLMSSRLLSLYIVFNIFDEKRKLSSLKYGIHIEFRYKTFNVRRSMQMSLVELTWDLSPSLMSEIYEDDNRDQYSKWNENCHVDNNWKSPRFLVSRDLCCGRRRHCCSWCL